MLARCGETREKKTAHIDQITTGFYTALNNVCRFARGLEAFNLGHPLFQSVFVQVMLERLVILSDNAGNRWF
jgi:hypothetical protein